MTDQWNMSKIITEHHIIWEKCGENIYIFMVKACWNYTIIENYDTKQWIFMAKSMLEFHTYC